MGKKFLIVMLAVFATGMGTVGIIMNTKKARAKRFAKKIGSAMYAVGSMLCTLSCQGATR